MNTPWERLRKERHRLGLNQGDFGALGGVQKQAQLKYEKGERKPDAAYLAGIAAGGADVAYILTGETLALRDALSDIGKSTEIAVKLGGSAQEISQHQSEIFKGLRSARESDKDEAALLADYRACSVEDQRTIRKMASALAAPAIRTRTRKEAK